MRSRGRGEGPSTFDRSQGVDAPLLLEGLPHEAPFGLLARILPAQLRAELHFQVHRLPRPRALELLRESRSVAETELATASDRGPTPAELEDEMESARALGEQVARREQELFRVGFCLHALAPTVRPAEQLRAELARRAQALGFRTRRPLYEARAAVEAAAFDGSEPRPSGYWHTLPTDGVAAFFPFLDEMVGEPGGILVGLLLDDAAPVFLNRFAHASYSWGIFGATGSGKSFLAALTALRSRWMDPELDLVFVDPLGEFGSFVRALGGSVVSLARDGSGRLNPLDPVTTGLDYEEKAARVGVFLRALFPSLADHESAVLDAALRRLFDQGGEPTFSTLRDEVERRSPASRLSMLLETLTTGSLRYLDGPTTIEWGSAPIDIDLSGAVDSQLGFHLAYVLDAVLGRLRRRPGRKLVVLDEAHLLARDPSTASFLDRLVRHIRHYDGGVLLLSQNPDDFLTTESGRSLLRNLRATVLLRLPEVSEPAREFFHLTTAEAEWLPRARLPREAGYSEGLLRHGPAHLPIALIASTPEHEFVAGTLGAPPPTGR